MRKSVARKTVMRSIASNAGGNRSSTRGMTQFQAPPTATVLPTLVRHAEVLVALLAWISLLRLVLFVHYAWMNTMLMVVVIVLVVHAYSMRPYCTEFDEDEEEQISSMLEGKGFPTGEVSDKSHLEEWKLVCLLLLFLSCVGTVVAFSNGGGKVFSTWTSPSITKCSVADLAKLEAKYDRFYCDDGFADLARQKSLMTKGGVMVSTYTAYRMAPIYAEEEKKKDDSTEKERDDSTEKKRDDSTEKKKDDTTVHADEKEERRGAHEEKKNEKKNNEKKKNEKKNEGEEERRSLSERAPNAIPVAWAVSKNQHLVGSYCKQGVCGMYAKIEDTDADAKAFKTLQQLWRKELVSAGADEFDEDSIPAVFLTNPSDPEGKTPHFLVGMFFYIVVLLGLITLQIHMCLETPSKADGESLERWRGNGDAEAQGGARYEYLVSAASTPAAKLSARTSFS